MKPVQIRSSVAGLDMTATQRELGRKLDELYQELFNLRFQWSTRQLKNSTRLTQVRHEIARVKTILREKELEGGK